MSDLDFDAIERLLHYGVIGDNPTNVSGASVNDVVDAALALIAEVRALREWVATLEGGIRAYVCSPERDAAWDDLCALLDTSEEPAWNRNCGCGSATTKPTATTTQPRKLRR